MQEGLKTDFQKFIYYTKYSRYNHQEKRRECYSESINRYLDFFQEYLNENNNFEISEDLRKKIFSKLIRQDVMPSMRCFATAGKALKKDQVAGYNCAYTNVTKIKDFSEILYCSMCGSGVGSSVERKYIQLLPDIPHELYDSDTIIIVSDSKIGWAKALNELLQLLWNGSIPKWDLSKIRAKGELLKTFGGRASGPEPLNQLFLFLVDIFKKARGRKLKSIEIFDILCMTAECVISGGSRRCLIENTEVMMGDGNWKQIKDIKKDETILLLTEEYKVLNNFDNGIQETVKIYNEDGTWQESTPEHKWLVYNHNLNLIEWVMAKDLDKGEYSFVSED